MIYYFVRILCQLSLWTNFRKIYLENFDLAPDPPTVIYGLNHPTAFIDPIALGCHVDQDCWFMLRGDKFVNAPARWGLHQIRNLPIFREKFGGIAAVKKNLDTMDFSTDRVILSEPTVILSEGDCKHERRLRTIQRGTARMMFQAQAKAPAANVCIVPVAVNYTKPNEFRSSLYLTFGKPICAKDYLEDYANDKRATVNDVSSELHRRLRQLVIHVEDKANDQLVEKILPVVQNCFPDQGWKPTSTVAPARAAQWRAVEAINHFDDFQISDLTRKIDTYRADLATHDLTDSGVSLPEYGSFWRAVMLVLLGPLAIFGLLLNYAQAMFVQRRTEKMVSNPQFFASVRWSMGIAVFFLVYLIWTCVVCYFLGWIGLLTPIVFGLSGYFSLMWYESFDLWRKAARTKSVSPAQMLSLKAQRNDILTQLGVSTSPAAVSV